jgi:hypothetical protein
VTGDLKAQIKAKWRHEWWGLTECDRCPNRSTQGPGPCDSCGLWPYLIKNERILKVVKKAEGPKTVWVLTYEVNDYNQQGEYFLAVWAAKPDLLQLSDYFAANGPVNFGSVMETVSALEHLRNGGGRRSTEDTWYMLKEVGLR